MLSKGEHKYTSGESSFISKTFRFLIISALFSITVLSFSSIEKLIYFLLFFRVFGKAIVPSKPVSIKANKFELLAFISIETFVFSVYDFTF